MQSSSNPLSSALHTPNASPSNVGKKHTFPSSVLKSKFPSSKSLSLSSLPLMRISSVPVISILTTLYSFGHVVPALGIQSILPPSLR